MSRAALCGLPRQELLAALADALPEEPAYRSRSIAGWIYERRAASFDDMTDLPVRIRAALAARFVIHPLERRRRADDPDGTIRFLWSLPDGAPVESVAIPGEDRSTYCLSSQSGCRLGCLFCATGRGGFRRSLDAGEIVGQVLAMKVETGDAPPLTNLVFMGMGEPLLAYDAVDRAIRILTDPALGGIGSRRITVSTVGVPDGIERISRDHPQVKLAISLHAADDGLRSRLIPFNRKHSIADVLGAARRFAAKVVTIEYIVIPGVNDRPADAQNLARILEGLRSRVNLIALHGFPGCPFPAATEGDVETFRRLLAGHFQRTITVRTSRGSEVGGACGQLSLDRERT
ncbi:MAG: 23S rRNA (adenine(2503)-C(2))-methyltransferase RlmN [Planctomycetes bacterium]|nr:23S rRNA (adenine(2503)-C(2))-methyltransferase RlmN [Planctomycetota bacterium]